MKKGIYPSKYSDDRERSNETSETEKEDFNSHLNMEDITVADYVHAKRVCKHYFQNNTLLLADVFENFRNSWNIWAWSCKISFSSGISMTSSFKKTKVKLDLSTDIDVIKVLEEKYVIQFINTQKLITIQKRLW